VALISGWVSEVRIGLWGDCVAVPVGVICLGLLEGVSIPAAKGPMQADMNRRTRTAGKTRNFIVA